MEALDELAAASPVLVEAYDATRPEFTRFAARVASWFDGRSETAGALDTTIRSRRPVEETIGLRVALKLAESRRVVASLDQPITLTLLNPVYKETGRMLPRSEHPHGEDSLRTKIEVLREFERLNSNFRTRLIVIDDECPDGSGLLARSILDEYGADLPHRVLFLGDAIDRGDPDLPPGLTHKDGSRRSVKGGSVLYGMRSSLRDPVAGRHILVDNDADLSIHPGQLGLLLRPIVEGSHPVVAGSRREDDSVATIGSSRDSRGQLFIEIWQRLLPRLAERITDTNRAFKAFDADALVQVIDDIGTYTFPYQIELLQACVSSGIPVSPCGIAYLDSEAASTPQGETITETYLHQIQQIIEIARRYETVDPDDGLLTLLDAISDREWAAIEADPPDDITSLVRPPAGA